MVAALGPLCYRFFTADAAIIAGGAVLLRFAILLEPGRVFNIVVINSLRATGDVGFTIRLAALSMWLVWVPLAWFLSLKMGWGLKGIWIAMATDEWLRGLLLYRRWKRREWLPFAERSYERVQRESVSAAAGATPG